MTRIDIEEFHKSTANEFEAIKNRVRNLIGKANWGDEGRYRESILKSVIRRFLPKKYEIGTGFVVKNLERDKQPEVSKQIDIIIYDTDRAVLFSEGDFVILLPEAINGIIEVKANIEKQKLTEIIEKANSNGFFISDAKIYRKEIFNGIFGYEGYNSEDKIIKHIDKFISKSVSKYTAKKNYNTFLVNHISFNKDYFVKYWRGKETYSFYRLEDLSYSFFIFNLIVHLTSKAERITVNESNIWFPVDKERKKLHDFPLSSSTKEKNRILGQK